MRYKVAQYETSTSDGGSVKVACSYAIKLDKTHFDSIFIVKYRDINSVNDRMLVENGIKIRTIFSGGVPKDANFIRKATRKIIEAVYVPISLLRILQQEKVDILHIHAGIMYFQNINWKIKGIRLFFTCHTDPQIYFLGKDRRNRNACRKLIKYNKLRLIALHDVMRLDLNRIFNVNNTVVIKNGIDFDSFTSITKSKANIRRLLGIPHDAFVVGHIGRFSPEKNQEFLIKVFLKVLQENEKSYLLLVGSGRTMVHIMGVINQLGIEDHCKILSNRSDVPELLKAMDVFVFPSKYEGLGIALIEAQVAGLRCIVSDKVPKETFQTKLAVEMSLDASIDEWAEAILNYQIMGDSEIDINEYNLKNTVKKLENLYLENESDKK